MKYVAKYSGIYYHAAVEAAAEAISSDKYYAKRSTKFGTGGVLCCSDSSIGWGDWYLNLTDDGQEYLEIDPDAGWFSDDQLRKAVYSRKTVQWLSCAGNLCAFRFNHAAKTVTMTIDSARHGIPDMASCLRHVKPDKMTTYETQEQGWEWWETLSDISKREERRSGLIKAGGFIRI